MAALLTAVLKEDVNIKTNIKREMSEIAGNYAKQRQNKLNLQQM
jgi:hypothetical protein